MTTLLYLTTVCLGTGFFLMARGLLEAPEGYQDETGFHFVGQPALVRSDVLASTVGGGRDSVGHVAGSIAQA